MSTIIGQVDINLRMSLAQFKKDVQDGTDAVRSGTKGMADDIKANTFEARGTLMLLGEEIGVHIPRHLQRMIAELPGVGPALATAFSSVAVLAAIEVIAKVIEKIQKYREEAQKTAEAWTQLGVETVKSSDAIRVANDKLEESLARLQGKTPNGIKTLLDEARKAADELADALDKDGKKMDDLIKKSGVSLFARLFEGAEGISDVQAAYTKLHESVKEVSDEAGRQLSVAKSTGEAEKIRAEAAKRIADLYSTANTQLEGMVKHP